MAVHVLINISAYFSHGTPRAAPEFSPNLLAV